MQPSDLQVIKDIPGYRVILKTVLKSQIQQLVEQLAEHTGEETVILTASVSDGSFSHLGSESGKVFLEDHDDIRSQFLGFCLKHHHKHKLLEKDQEQQQQQHQQQLQDPGGQILMAPTTPTRFGSGTRPRFSPAHVHTSPRQFSSHGSQPISLTGISPHSVPNGANVRHEPNPGAGPRTPVNPCPHRRLPHPTNSRKLPAEHGSAQKINTMPDGGIKIEAMDEEIENTNKLRTKERNSSANSGMRESGSGTESTTSTATASQSQNGILPILPNCSLSAAGNVIDKGSDSLSQKISSELSEVKYSDSIPLGGYSLDSDLSNLSGLPSERGNMDTCSSGSDSVVKDSNVILNIKSEAIPELDLDITGVLSGQVTQPNIQTGMEFSPSASGGAQGSVEDQSSQGCSITKLCEGHAPESDEDVPESKRGKYALYSLKEKQEILEDVAKLGLRATARKFGIASSTISSWKKDLADDTGTRRHKSGRRVGGGRKLTYDKEIEEKVAIYVIERKEHKLPVSHASLRRYILSLTKAKYPDFKASNGWMRRFMDRNNCWHQATVSQKLLPELETRLATFYRHLSELRTSKELNDEAFIINMDEVPMIIDNVPPRTSNKLDERNVPVRSTEGEKQRYTAVLSVNAAGKFLPTMVICKGKPDQKDPEMPQGWVMCYNDKAWMREDVMMHWIKEVLLPYTKQCKTLLVIDSFPVHKTATVQTELERNNVFPVIIPGGCTSKAQPLDIVINSQYKDRVQQCLNLHKQDRQAEAKDNLTMTGTSCQDVIGWMSTTQNELSQTDFIEKSFKITGISTALDGTEDHMIRDPSLITENNNVAGVREIDEFSDLEEDEVDDQ